MTSAEIHYSLCPNIFTKPLFRYKRRPFNRLYSHAGSRKSLVSRLTATGLPGGTAPLFEKLRDETCLHEYLLSSPFSPLVIRSSSPSVAFRLSFSLIFILSSLIALKNGVHPFLRSLFFAPFFTCSIVFLSFVRMQPPSTTFLVDRRCAGS